MDGRNKRKERSAAAFRHALERLRTGSGTHPLHVGIKVRITKQAVAREARISSATLYRLPDVCAEIDAAQGSSPVRTLRPAEQRRRMLHETIRSLEERNAALLSENLRLTRALARFDPSLGDGTVPSLAQHRANRRISAQPRASSES
jgi:hypothetical protein